jgi:hypothetical protein
VKAAILGCFIAGLLALATAAASWPGSPLRAGSPERSDVPSVVFLAAAACAFAAYVAALLLLRFPGRGLRARDRDPARPADRAAPALAGRLCLLGLRTARNPARRKPYAVAPSRFPADPAIQAMAPAWRTTKTVYGPVFTGASAGFAQASGRSGETAAYTYRLAAAPGMLVLVAFAALVAPVPAFGVAFVGWNPLLAIDFAGGGHNDVWMMVLVFGALALAARHPRLSGSGWALAAGVKRVALALVPLELLREPRARAATLGFVAAAGAIATAAFAFGTAWLTAVVPVAQRQAAWAVPSRLGVLGLPGWLAFVPLAVAVPWLVRSARAGRRRLGLTSGLLLVGTPWLLPWYAVWAVPLAAIEEDALAWVLTLALCAYLLPDRVPI